MGANEKLMTRRSLFQKAAVAVLVAPVAFAGYVAFHPGIAFAAPTYGPAQKVQVAGNYTVDPAHTSIGFEVTHLGLSHVQGRFAEKSGKIVIGKDAASSSVEITIPSKSVDTNVAPRDAHLRTADFFDAEQYPTLTFKSTKVTKSGSGYTVDGQLTMRGVTKNVSIPFDYFGPITDPWGGTRIGAIAKPIKLNRKDYGFPYNEALPDGTPAVSNDITVRIALEATLDKPGK